MPPALALAPRRLGAVNWIGLRTLYLKEVRRFAKVFTQTLVSPLVTTLLFLAIFTLALGRSVQQVGGVGYAEFLFPGLVMMSMVQNAFANTSSSLVIAKIQGNIVDLLMPPLSPLELSLGLAGGGLTRGICVGLVSTLAVSLLLPIHVHDWFFIVFHAIGASLMLSLIGVLAGLWADKFDQMAAVTNFLIQPLSFLSGAFYSTQRLPDLWRTIAHLNPFFYMIDGFRYGFIDHADASPTVGLCVMLGVDALLLLAVHAWFRRGYRLKA